MPGWKVPRRLGRREVLPPSNSEKAQSCSKFQPACCACGQNGQNVFKTSVSKHCLGLRQSLQPTTFGMVRTALFAAPVMQLCLDCCLISQRLLGKHRPTCSSILSCVVSARHTRSADFGVHTFHNENTVLLFLGLVLVLQWLRPRLKTF